LFWFGAIDQAFSVWSANRFENRAFDHLAFGTRGTPILGMEITLLSWRNHFTADLYGEHGSAHIDSLCKWGPSTFTRRTRVLPSGRPPEEAITLVQPDPTWAVEYQYFRRLCEGGAGVANTLAKDIRLNEILAELARQAATRPGAG
jgi:hypothetical protein